MFETTPQMPPALAEFLHHIDFAQLARLPPADLDDDAALAAAAGWERLIAHAHAQQLRALARFADLRPARDARRCDEFAADELALELRLTAPAAGRRLATAVGLADRLPGVLAALDRGEIDLGRAQLIDELTTPLSDEHAARVAQMVLPRAAGQNRSQLRQSTRRAVLRVDPGGAAARRRRALADRQVGAHAREDGMADLSIFAAAPDIAAAYAHVDALARVARADGDERTLDQIRADTALDLLTGRHIHTAACPGGAAGGAQVHVTVGLATLLGLDDEPAELAGHGPISAELAREIAGDATWRRLLTDPQSGTLLDYGRTVYRPPASLADHVRARDRTCVFPGCRRQARGCDLDHRIPFPDGPTAAWNLAALCRRHHRLKQHPRWQLIRDESGRHTWITPTGRAHTRDPEPLTEPPPPEPPPEPEPQPPPPEPKPEDDIPPF